MLKHLPMLCWGKLLKTEAHKSSGIREVIKCLCDVFGCRAMLCRPVLFRYPSRAVLTAGGWGMALASRAPQRRGVWGAHDAGSLRWHQGTVPSACFLLTAAVFAGTASVPGPPSHPSLLLSQQIPRLPVSAGMQMAQSSLTVLFPVPGTAPQPGICPRRVDVEGKLPFFLQWFLLQSQKMRILQHQHFVPKQTLSPGHSDPRLLGRRKMEMKYQKNCCSWLITYWLVPRISIDQQAVLLPWAIQSHFQRIQKCLAGTYDLTGICYTAPDYLCHFILTVVNKTLQVTARVSLSTLASSVRSAEALAIGVSQGWLCWARWAPTSLLRIQIILNSLHSSSQEWVKQLK